MFKNRCSICGASFFKLKNVKDYKKQLKLNASKKRDFSGIGRNMGDVSDKRATNFKNGMNILYDSGESNYDKILSGIYENFLFSTKSDTNFKIVRTVEKSLVNFDLVNSKIRQSQNYSIMTFLPVFLTSFHMKYATGGGLYTKLKYPSLHAENYKKKCSNIEFLRKLQNTNNTGLYQGKSQNSASDLFIGLPLVAKMTEFPGPNRNVAPPMYNNNEKQFISDQVDRIVSSNLMINQEKVAINFANPEKDFTFGGYEYVIEPNIYALARMSFKRIEKIGDLESKNLDKDENKSKKNVNDIVQTDPLAGPALKVTCNITYAQTQYLANFMQREIAERFERSQQVRKAESNLKRSFSKKNTIVSTPERAKKVSPSVSGVSTPNSYSVTRLEDLQKNKKSSSNLLSEKSAKPAWNQKELWKKFLDVKTTPKPAEILRNRSRNNQISGGSSKSLDSDYQLEFDPGIANSDVYFKHRKGFCKSVRATVRAWEYL